MVPDLILVGHGAAMETPEDAQYLVEFGEGGRYRLGLEDREFETGDWLNVLFGWIARYPCRTQVVAAMNLCRCGRWGATSGAACPSRRRRLRRSSSCCNAASVSASSRSALA